MAGKGLGQGLEALLGEGALEERATDFDYVPVSRLEPRQGQPRKVFDEVSLQELADSIAEHGVLQPLTVRPLSDGYYQIIAGERRWRAARLAGLAVGFYNREDFKDEKSEVYEPQMNKEEVERLYTRWLKAVKATQEF